MYPYQERVIEERADLAAKLKKLQIFLVSPAGFNLPSPEQQRLRRQLLAMHNYLDILDERIVAFQE